MEGALKESTAADQNAGFLQRFQTILPIGMMSALGFQTRKSRLQIAFVDDAAPEDIQYNRGQLLGTIPTGIGAHLIEHALAKGQVVWTQELS
ncbi:hypothetical protein [Mesorhizobium sp.]|uniref:hypothetical protein n=1 Tax=Mesorhizobium sp. TaxID=1871066 RepID=UPI0025EB5334|nr:hypothetical protein [Mesorhizobium sp.]